MKVAVTKEDIQEGRPGSYDSCPVALAVARRLELPKGLVVQVTKSSVVIAKRNSPNWFGLRSPAHRPCLLPRVASVFIDRFDLAKAPQRMKPPAEFEINCPEIDRYMKKEEA